MHLLGFSVQAQNYESPQQYSPEDYSYRVSRFTAADGLPSGRVYSIEEDSLGLLWLGTDNGLVRFDGRSFTTYKPIPGDTTSISNLAVFTVSAFSKSKLLSAGGGLSSGGLDIFDVDTERFTRVNPEFSGLRTNLVSSIERARFDPRYAWIGLLGQELNNSLMLLDIEEQRAIKPPDHLAEVFQQDDWIMSMLEDSDDFLWVARAFLKPNDGLHRISLVTDSVSAYFEGEEVRKVYQDRKGTIWVGSSLGLHRFNKEKGTFETFETDDKSPIRLILEDSRGEFWVATKNVLYTFDRQKERFERFRYQPQGPEIHDLHEDRFGTVWVGAFELLKIERYKNVFAYYENLSQHAASGFLTIFKDRNGRVWQAEEDVVIRNADTNNEEVRFEFSSAYGIYEDRQGEIWLSRTCSGELVHLSGLSLENQVIYSIDEYLNDQNLQNGCMNRVMEDREGNLWVPVYFGGIGLLDRKTKKFKFYTPESHGLGTHQVIRINEAASEPGILWVSTSAGVSRFDIQNESFTNYYSDLLARTMMTLEDTKGRFWIATAGNGLHLFDRDNGVVERTYTRRDGLSHDIVRSVYEDNQGMLWMCTGNGVTQFNPDKRVVQRV